ncbi:MAG: hypothetical protein LBS67_01265 [Clostridiales Family XIII bacterium]|jgi:hypothetical protein|nr:hypothetical protein [Clostridiales Family XIII bacterium]
MTHKGISEITAKTFSVICAVCALLALASVLSSCAQPSDNGNGSEGAADETVVTEEGADPAPDATTSEEGETSGAATDEGVPAPSGEPDADASVSLIGDSVPLGAVPQIEEALPGAEMLVRTDRDLAGPGIELLKEENEAGKLGDIVVLALGTSNLTKANIDAAVEVIGEGRQIVFVNAYRGGAPYIEGVNAAIDEAAAERPDSFTVADWYGYVEAHPDLELAEDNCHLTESSAKDYAALIKSAVDEARVKADAR